MDVLATILAGLGLFFIGVKFIGGNLKQITARGFRIVIARAVSTYGAAAAVGVLAGALTQSTNAVTFICINSVSAGLSTARKILPVLIWANLGTSALVLLATFDVHLVVSLLIAAVGVLYYLDVDKSSRFRHAAAALLGLGLLFLGIELIRNGADGLTRMPQVLGAMDYARQSFVLLFAVGFGIAILAQSSATVTVVAVTLAQAGLLHLDQAISTIYGAGLGSGIAVWLMSARLAGTSKRLAALQVLTKVAGAAVLLPLFIVEEVAGAPLVKAGVTLISADVRQQVACVYLLYQVVSAVTVSAMLGPLYRLVERTFPQTAAENLSRPQFIYAGGDVDAETGALLAQKEQRRLLGFVRNSLESIHPDHALTTHASPELLHEAAQSIGGEVSSFISELTEASPPRETMERLSQLRLAQSVLDELADEIYSLVKQVRVKAPGPALDSSIRGMIEGLHAIVMVLLDELDEPDEFQRASLAVMTSDRSDMMDRLRRELMQHGEGLTKAEQNLLFAVSAHFEHAVWLVRRFLKLAQDQPS